MANGIDEKLKEQVKKQLQEKAGITTADTAAETGPSIENGAQEVRQELEASRYIPPKSQWKKQTKTEDVAMFFREMAILLESGYPLLRGLNLLAKKVSNKDLAGDIDRIALDVEKGSTLAKAMASFPWHFPPMAVSMIEAGESSGQLVESFNNVADDLEINQEFAEKIRRALAYPVLTLLFGLGALMIVLIVVVPRFYAVYDLHNMDLPFFTGLVVAMSKFVTELWWIWVPAVAIVGYWLYKKIRNNTSMFDGLILRTPVIGEIVVLGSMARFTSSLKVLLANGVPLPQSLDLAEGSMDNRILRDLVQRMKEQVQIGKSMVTPLENLDYLPPIVVDMLMVGQESGKMPFVLYQITKALRMRLDRLIENLSVTMGPVLTLVVGVLVLLVALTLFVPYFEFLPNIAEIR